MNHVMIDIETLSTRANAVIVSIGAVKFDPKNGEAGDKFFVTLDIQHQINDGLTVDGSTVSWWMSQSDEARRSAFKGNNFRNLGATLSDLSNFIDYGSFVWGNPANFDLTIIESARLKYGLIEEQLWNRKNVMCLRTLKNLVPDRIYKTEFEGVPHDPLDDCWHQIKQVVKIYDHLGL